MDKKLKKNPEIESVSEENKANGKKSPNRDRMLENVRNKTVELIESGAYKKTKKEGSTYTPPEILLPRDNSEKTKKIYLGFSKFERKIKQARWVKSVLLGASLTFFVAGLLTLLSRTNVVSLSGWVIALIAVGSFFVGWAPTFVLSGVKLEKIAKELDSKFKLKEKASSTLETLDNDSEMGVLLRNDLRKEIEKIEADEIKAYKRIWLCACAFIIGFTMLVVGLAFPKPSTEENDDESNSTQVEYFTLTKDQEDKLNEIINNVKASEMEETAKNNVVLEIENLLRLLKNVKMSKTDALNAVKLTTGKIDSITVDTGSQYKLYIALKSQDSPYTREFARLLTKFDWDKHLIKRADIQALFVHKDELLEEPDVELMKVDTVRLLNDVSANMLAALDASKVDPSDPLYDLLYRFTTENDPQNKEAKGEGLYGTQEIASEMEYLSYRWSQKRLEALFSILGEDIFRELMEQNENYSAGYGAANDIRSLFGLPRVDREDTTKEEEEEDEENKLPPEDADGGGGNGNIFMGDDTIYDEEKRTHVTYGEVIDIYYKIMQDGQYTPEQKEAIQKYFETLYKGFDEEKDED